MIYGQLFLVGDEIFYKSLAKQDGVWKKWCKAIVNSKKIVIFTPLYIHYGIYFTTYRRG